MRTVVHEVFGDVEFDPESTENDWESEIELAGRTVGLDMTFDGAAVDDGLLDRLAPFISDVTRFDSAARAAIRADLSEEESAVRDYIEHHLDEPDVVEEVFGGTTPDTDGFLTALHLVRVWFHPDDDYEAVFDYSIGEEVTQYVVVVKFAGDRITEVTTES